MWVCATNHMGHGHIIHWASFSLSTLWLEINCFSPSCSPKDFCFLHSALPMALPPFLRMSQFWAKLSLLQGKAGANVKFCSGYSLSPVKLAAGFLLTPTGPCLQLFRLSAPNFCGLSNSASKRGGSLLPNTERSSEFHHPQLPEHSSDLS